MGSFYVLRAELAATLGASASTVSGHMLEIQPDGSLMAGNTRCRPGVLERVPWHILPVLWCPAEMEQSEVIDTRTVTESAPVQPSWLEIVVVGGCDATKQGGFYDASCEVEAYSPFLETWRALAPTKSRRDEHIVVCADNQLVAIGGRGATVEAEMYDSRDDKWMIGPDSPSLLRPWTAAAWIADFLVPCATVTHQFSEQWRECLPLLQARHGHGLARVNQNIYAIGGSVSRGVQASVECYALGSWRGVAPMQQPRKNFGVAVIGNQIYAIGGEASGKCLSDCERYDTAINQWTPIKPMSHARRFLAAASIDGQVYAIGGREPDGGVHNRVEKYDPETDSWSSLPRMPGGGKWGLAAAVIDSTRHFMR